MSGRGWSRREFLSRMGRGAVFCGVVGATGKSLTGCELHEETPNISGGLRRFFTPTDGELGEDFWDDFFIQFGNPGTSFEDHPQLAEEDWELRIIGGETEVTIDFERLKAVGDQSSIVFLKTMRCVLDSPSEALISNAYWRGVPLNVFIAETGTLPEGATRLRITAYDDFENNLRIPRVMEDVEEGVDAAVTLLPVVLAYEMNGKDIPQVHGGPVRIIVPEKFGFKNIKWPRQIEITAEDVPFGYYETELFSGSPITDVGNMSLTSVASGPIEGEGVAPGRVRFFGYALDGLDGIDRVEVSVDDGAFESATIQRLTDILQDPVLAFGVDTPEGSELLDGLQSELEQLDADRFPDLQHLPYVWVLWEFEKELASGEHSVAVRATTVGGVTQPDRDTDLDDGNSRIRRIEFTVL